MGIYIPGIETPKEHNYVTITIWHSGNASCGLFDREENLCDFKSIKAVPVPEHGRLIDADALITDNAGKWTVYDLQRFANAPTIIPEEPAREEKN